MSYGRADDFATRRTHLRELTDEQLHARFWELSERVVAPLIEEARTHTTPAIERSVLLRMGFDSRQARELATRMQGAGLLGRGAGKLVLELAQRRGISVTEAGEALLHGDGWEELRR